LRKTESFSSLFISLITLNESWSRKKHFLGKKKLALKKRKCFYFNFLQKNNTLFPELSKNKKQKKSKVKWLNIFFIWLLFVLFKINYKLILFFNFIPFNFLFIK
jgi:hypothetical protein